MAANLTPISSEVLKNRDENGNRVCVAGRFHDKTWHMLLLYT
jgi:hypothetical protein